MKATIWAGLLLRIAGMLVFGPSNLAAAQPASGDFWPPAWDSRQQPSPKADEHDDFRLSHTDWYGVSAPPSVSVRPHAEFAPVQAVMLRPTRDIGSYHRLLIGELLGHVPRVILLHSAGHDVLMKEALASYGIPLDDLRFLPVDTTDSVWTRDYGPMSVLGPGERIGFVDFRYYQQRQYDDAVPTKAADRLGVSVYRPTLSLEGGNFMADTAGTCYLTEKLYTQNPAWSPEMVDEWMTEYLGCHQMVILLRPEELGTGHIDMFCKLVSDDRVLLGSYDPLVRPTNAGILDANADILSSTLPRTGVPLQVLRIPLPWDDRGVWFTYTNALMANDRVLVPVYDGFSELEAQALAVYRQALPEHSISTIPSDSIIPSGGAVHCVTMEIPSGAWEPLEDGPAMLCGNADLRKCPEALLPCGGLPTEGACVGEELWTCGPLGYPVASDCEVCCGPQLSALEGMGWSSCLSGAECIGCRDECQSGETGCSVSGTHSWTCGQVDEDPCNDRLWLPCETGLVCRQGTGLCLTQEAPTCPVSGSDCGPEGLRHCTEDGSIVEVCLRGPDSCLSWVPAEFCEPSHACQGVACVALPDWAFPNGEGVLLESGTTGTQGGCGPGLGSGQTVATLLLSLLLVLLRIASGKERQEATGTQERSLTTPTIRR